MHDVVQLVISPAFCLKRRLSVRLKLARRPKGRFETGKERSSECMFFVDILETCYAPG